MAPTSTIDAQDEKPEAALTIGLGLLLASLMAYILFGNSGRRID